MIINPKGFLINTLKMEFCSWRQGMLVIPWEKITSCRFGLKT